MYNLSHIRRRVETLKRGCAPELAVIRLRRLSQEFCDDWDEAVSKEKPAPRHVLDAKISDFIPPHPQGPLPAGHLDGHAQAPGTLHRRQKTP